MNNNKLDMASLMSMLSKMDKKELIQIIQKSEEEEGLNKVSKMLNSKQADQVIDQIKKNANEQ